MLLADETGCSSVLNVLFNGAFSFMNGYTDSRHYDTQPYVFTEWD